MGASLRPTHYKYHFYLLHFSSYLFPKLSSNLSPKFSPKLFPKLSHTLSSNLLLNIFQSPRETVFKPLPKQHVDNQSLGPSSTLPPMRYSGYGDNHSSTIFSGPSLRSSLDRSPKRFSSPSSTPQFSEVRPVDDHLVRVYSLDGVYRGTTPLPFLSPVSTVGIVTRSQLTVSQ